MQIIPKSAPTSVEGHIADSQIKAQSARERAIARLSGIDPQGANQSQISPEEAVVAAAPPANAEASAPEGQTTNVEASAPGEAPKEATASEEAPLSSQYAQLARKEKALRLQAQELRKQQDAFKQREEAIKAQEAEMLNRYVPKDRLVKDPWSVLNENNVSYEQITQQALNAPAPEQLAQQRAMQELRDEIKALRDGQESTKKTFEDSQKQAYTQAVSQIRNETKQLVSSNEAFETIHATGAYDDVVELITKTHASEGILLSVEEAAAAVEEHLVEEAMKVARLKKIQERLKPKAAAPAVASAKPAELQKPQLKTLTNTVGASRQLTARERALMAFKGEKF